MTARHRGALGALLLSLACSPAAPRRSSAPSTPRPSPTATRLATRRRRPPRGRPRRDARPAGRPGSDVTSAARRGARGARRGAGGHAAARRPAPPFEAGATASWPPSPPRSAGRPPGVAREVPKKERAIATRSADLVGYALAPAPCTWWWSGAAQRLVLVTQAVGAATPVAVRLVDRDDPEAGLRGGGGGSLGPAELRPSPGRRPRPSTTT